MNKLLPVLVLSVVTMSAFGQLQKGNIVINGFASVGLQKQTTNGFTTTESETVNFSIQPRIGWFIGDKTVFGVGLSGDYAKSEFTYPSGFPTLSSNINKQATYSITPYLRKYFSISERFSFFVDGNASIGIVQTEYKNTGIDFNGTLVTTSGSSNGPSLGLALKPGFAYFISNKWGIEATFAKLNVGYSKPGDTDNYNLRLSTGLEGFSFGMGYYVNR